MSIIFMESFDGLAASQATRKYDSAQSIAFNTTSGRRGTNGLQLGSTTTLGKNLGSDYTTAVFAGCALFTDGNLPSSAGAFMTFQEGATVHVAICVNNQGRLQARLASSGGAVIAESGVGVIPASGNNYIEAKVVVHDSTGSVVLRVNGVQVASASNVDTRNGGTSGVCNRVQLQGAGNPTVYGADDFYIGDTNGSNNDFLGDVRVDFLAVNAAGNYTEFTPSAGSNFQNVDDGATADDDTTYNESDVDNERDSYQHASLASLVVEQIKAVQVFVQAKKSDAGSRSLKVGIRSGTTDNVDSGTALGTAYTGYRRTFDTDPNTAAAWTKSACDAVESMVQVGAP